MGLLPHAAAAQSAAPITVTPPTLVPEAPGKDAEVVIPEMQALAPPKGAENVTVLLGGVVIEGGFPQVASQTGPIGDGLAGRRVSLKEIYAAASEIEAVHVRAGFVLARVSVPPQELQDGATLRIVVTDGFVEKVDVSGVPDRVRRPVTWATASLSGQHHLRLRDIEEALMIASDVPGLSLRSTLMRGTLPGGTILVLDGKQKLVSANIGIDNGFDETLGTWGVHADVSLNSALGLGEQIYGSVASGYDLGKMFQNSAPVWVAGGGIVFRAARGRFTINPEVTFARTRPEAPPGALQTVGALRRLTLRASYMLLRTRKEALSIGATVEQLDEVSKAPDFGYTISHDRYMATRFGISWFKQEANNASYSIAVQLSQGLGNAGAISLGEAIGSGTPFSRQGANNDFTKLNMQASAVWPLLKNFDLALQGRAQTTFGRPVFRSEQFSLAGSTALSAYVGDATLVDEGITGRLELVGRLRLGKLHALALQPYLFAAVGAGRIDQPSVLEPRQFTACSYGVGARGALLRYLTLSIEYARATSGYAPLDRVHRVNVSVDLHL